MEVYIHHIFNEYYIRSISQNWRVNLPFFPIIALTKINFKNKRITLRVCLVWSKILLNFLIISWLKYFENNLQMNLFFSHLRKWLLYIYPATLFQPHHYLIHPDPILGFEPDIELGAHSRPWPQTRDSTLTQDSIPQIKTWPRSPHETKFRPRSKLRTLPWLQLDQDPDHGPNLTQDPTQTPDIG